MLDESRGSFLRLILIVASLSLVFLRTTSAEQDTGNIPSNYEIFDNFAIEKSNSDNNEVPVEVIARFVDPAREFNRKKRKAEEPKNSITNSLIANSAASKSTQTDSSKINVRTKASEKLYGKRSDALENDEDEEDDEDEDINEEISHHSKKRGGNERSLNLSTSVHRAARQGPKIWDQWGKWSSCSVSCGVGKLTRWRHCIAGSREPKIWDQWGKWSCCSASCGTGKITRWRHCMAGGCASGEKEAQLKACNIKSCR